MIKLLTLNNVKEAVIIRRVDRFKVLIRLENNDVLAHNTNTGRLNDVLIPGINALVIPIHGSKLRYRLIGVDYGGLYSILDTLTQEAAFRSAVELNVIPYLRNCSVVKRNPRFDDVVHDYLINCNGRYAVVEIKSAELRGIGSEAMYPDCPTLRGRKHLLNLISIKRNTTLNAYLIFIAAMPRPRCFMPYRQADPIIDELIRKALDEGIIVKSIAMYMDRFGNIYLENPDLPLCSEWLSS